MTKVFDRVVLAACIAITALSMAVSVAEGQDLDRSNRGALDEPRSRLESNRDDRGSDPRAFRDAGNAPMAPASPRRRRAARHIETRVAPRPTCELGLHGCYVRNGDRRGVF